MSSEFLATFSLAVIGGIGAALLANQLIKAAYSAQSGTGVDPETAEYINQVIAALVSEPAQNVRASDAVAKKRLMKLLVKFFKRANREEAARLCRSIATDPQTSEAVERAGVIVRRTHSSPSISRARLFLYILILILATAAGIGQMVLDATEQTLAANEIETVGLALAIFTTVRPGTENEKVKHDAEE